MRRTRQQTIRRRRLAAGAGALLALALIASLFAAIGSEIRPHDDRPGFKPGRIVEDRDFYAGGTMDADEVQDFLERKVSACAAPGACLAEYRMDLPAYPETERCRAIDALPAARAADIIAIVGRACDISERVLLVLLEKEQSLVTNPAPDAHRFDRATGYFCPDDPVRPGWCDPEYGGFANQVYFAAAQFQRYRMLPADFAYRAGAAVEIPYAPNAPECGAELVYLENDATAALYNYTPYVPNAAALDPATPDGDECSSFGNRNFWLLMTRWFGELPKRI